MIKRINNKDWKQYIFKENEGLPQPLIDLCNKENVFRSGFGEWYNDIVWYKGETPETATHWILIVDDGGYFKVGAKYSFWHSSQSGELYEWPQNLFENQFYRI